MPLIAVASNKFSRGFPSPSAPEAYVVTDLVAALEQRYATDAHHVVYHVEGRERQPRINKLGLPSFDGRVLIDVLFADVDNEAHAEWSPELLARARAQFDATPSLATCGVFTTKRGLRLVQPLKHPVEAADAEPVLRAWLAELEAAGVAIDWACRDWTRHFRLPRVRRDGTDTEPAWFDLSRMRARAVEPDPSLGPRAGEPVVRDEPKPRPPRAPVVVDWRPSAPEGWLDAVERVAGAMPPAGERHAAYLYLAGAFCRHGVEPSSIPALVRAIALAAGDDEPHDRERAARSTVERWLTGAPVGGLGRLPAGLAAAVIGAIASRTPTPSPIPEAPPVFDVTETITDAIRLAADGVTCIAAPCGAGKTHAAEVVAAERARSDARLDTHTAISVDKNSLALQIVGHLRALGVSVRRHFGALSIEGDEACIHREWALPFVEGGQSLQYEFCTGRGREKCERYASCTVRDGVDGPDDAKVDVGSHAMLSELNAAAGKTGLLVIDEPPAPLESAGVSDDDVKHARDRLGAFTEPFADAMRPVLAWAEKWDGIGAFARIEVPPDMDPPPLRRAQITAARFNRGLGVALGRASRTLGVLYRLMAADHAVARRERERVIVTLPRDDVAAALRREGRVVLTDAGLEPNVPVFGRIVGYEPRLVRVRATDGARIDRVIVRTRKATRTAWLAFGRAVLTPSLLAGLDAALGVAREQGARSVGIITMRPVVRALRGVVAGRERDCTTTAVVVDREAPGETGAEVAPPTTTPVSHVHSQGAPALEVRWGHYGGVRGLNSMSDVDGIITLGDPFPNLGDVRSDIRFLDLSLAWEVRAEALARAELEQAHGRLRAIRRKAPGFMVHVGRLAPSGDGWERARVIDLMVSDVLAATPAEVGRAVERAGGIYAMARQLGCSARDVRSLAAGLMYPSEPISLIVHEMLS